MVGYEPGQGTHRELGALLVAVHDGGELRYAGEVGSGIDTRQRQGVPRATGRAGALRPARRECAAHPRRALGGAAAGHPRRVLRVDHGRPAAPGGVQGHRAGQGSEDGDPGAADGDGDAIRRRAAAPERREARGGRTATPKRGERRPGRRHPQAAKPTQRRARPPTRPRSRRRPARRVARAEAPAWEGSQSGPIRRPRKRRPARPRAIGGGRPGRGGDGGRAGRPRRDDQGRRVGDRRARRQPDQPGQGAVPRGGLHQARPDPLLRDHLAGAAAAPARPAAQRGSLAGRRHRPALLAEADPVARARMGRALGLPGGRATTSRTPTWSATAWRRWPGWPTRPSSTCTRGPRGCRSGTCRRTR